jgi:hypothetical protein
MKIGIISNPLSRRNLKDPHGAREFAAQRDALMYEELVNFASLREVLQVFAEAGVELLVINGGDGTVSAVLTEIFERGIFPRRPTLAILPGGTSNMIAGDVGLVGDRVKSLARLLALVERGEIADHIETRSLIRMSYEPDGSAVVGMFFGTAAISKAITQHRHMFPQPWIPDPIASALTLVYVLAGVACGRDDLLSGEVIGVGLDDHTETESPYSIVMATTLKRFFLGTSPFWGRGDGALAFTSIRSPASGLLRHAYRLLYGRDKSTLPAATYRSALADRIALRMRCPFNLDGEFFHAPAGAEVVLTAEFQARFVRC